MTSPASEEIDLQSLAVSMLRFVQRNAVLMLGSAIVGALLGLGNYWMTPPVYESQMILISDSLTSSYGDQLAGTINKLIGEGNTAALSEKLALSPAESSELTWVNIERAANNKASSIAVTFVVTVRVRNNSILPNLQKGLLQYFQSNEWVKTRVRQREATYKALIAKLDQEIRSLDSLKLRLLQGKSVLNAGGGMLLVEPTNIYSKIIELSQLRLNYSNSLELQGSMQLIEGFTPFNQPVAPKLRTPIILGLAAGLLAALSFLLLRHLVRQAKQA